MASTVWRGRLAFGLVAIPVRMYKAARRERVRFHHVYRQEPPADVRPLTSAIRGAAARIDEPTEPEPAAWEPAEETSVVRVRNQPVTDFPDDRVEPARILKGFEVEKDRYVVLDPAELKALRPRTSSEVAIEQFVRMEEIDPLFLDVSYFLQPDNAVDKPYALFYRALAATGYAAQGSLAMHGREHAVVIRAGRRGLILHTLFHANEVRLEEEHPAGLDLVERRELELAESLVRALAAPFEPAKLTDRLEERVRELIESRTPAPLSGAAEPASRAPVVDIMEALRKSLLAARKPPATQPAARATGKRKKA